MTASPDQRQMTIKTLQQASVLARLVDNGISEWLAREANADQYNTPVPDFAPGIHENTFALVHKIYEASRADK